MCKKQLDIIEKDIDEIFFNADKQRAKFVGQGVYDPEALRDEVYYTIETGVIYLQCVTWSKEIKKKEYINDNLRLTIMNLEFNTWFENEAY